MSKEFCIDSGFSCWFNPPICIGDGPRATLFVNSSTTFFNCSHVALLPWYMAVCCLVVGSRIPTSTDFAWFSLTSSPVTSSTIFIFLSISVMRLRVSSVVFAGLATIPLKSINTMPCFDAKLGPNLMCSFCHALNPFSPFTVVATFRASPLVKFFKALQTCVSSSVTLVVYMLSRALAHEPSTKSFSTSTSLRNSFIPGLMWSK